MSFPTGSEDVLKLQTSQRRLHYLTDATSVPLDGNPLLASEQAHDIEPGQTITPPASPSLYIANATSLAASASQPLQALGAQLPAGLALGPPGMARSEGSQEPSDNGDDPQDEVPIAGFHGHEMDLDEESGWPANSLSTEPDFQSTLPYIPATQLHGTSVVAHDSDHRPGLANESNSLASSINELHAEVMDAEQNGNHERDHHQISAAAVTFGVVVHGQSTPSFPLFTASEEVASTQAPSPQQGHPQTSPATSIPSINTALFQAGLHQPDTGAADPQEAGNGAENSQPISPSDDPSPWQWSSQNALSQAVPPHLANNLLTDLYAWAEDETRNFDVCKFFDYWEDVNSEQPDRYPPGQLDYFPPITDETLQVLHRQKRIKISIDDLDYDHCDFQGLDWSALGVTREAARNVRRKTYVNHTNVLIHFEHRRRRYEPLFGASCYMNGQGRSFARNFANGDNQFRFRQMNMKYKVTQTHFQLRHMMSASSKNSIFYAGWQEIFCVNPEMDFEKSVLDLSKPHRDADAPILGKISAVSATDGVLIVGGFQGEYAMKSLSSSYDDTYTPGTILLRDENGSTNHIHTFLDRRSGLPQAVFSSNDDRVRVLDCNTNRIIREHDFGWAVNCSATSPDARLRAIVGDNCYPWIVNAETGERIFRLPDHKDYGFACAWSPDGRNVATGNQDGTVQIFDVRSFGAPVESPILATEIGGVRCMAFSPVGSGRRALVLAESADYVHVVDATTFESEQRFEFFGEISGVSFVPDGDSFWVANADHVFGGLMEFERAGVGGGFGIRQAEVEDEDEDEGIWNDWAEEGEMDGDDRVVQTEGWRRRRGLRLGELVI